MEYIVDIPKIENVKQLVKLNEKFLVDNLDPVQREKGFIRIRYDFDDFTRIVTAKEIVTAFNFEEIVAYYLIGRPATTHQIDYQKIMAEKVAQKFNISEERIGYSCQVCINKDFRHIGLFKNMLDLLSSNVKPKYDLLLCSISDSNIASYKAHTKNGWEFFDKTEKTNFYTLAIK